MDLCENNRLTLWIFIWRSLADRNLGYLSIQNVKIYKWINKNRRNQWHFEWRLKKTKSYSCVSRLSFKAVVINGSIPISRSIKECYQRSFFPKVCKYAMHAQILSEETRKDQILSTLETLITKIPKRLTFLG